jgi:hypothetical protein
MFPSPRTVSIVAALVALSIAGCGRSAFTNKANDVCKKYNDKLRALPLPTTASQVRGFLDNVAPLAAEAAAKLKALSPPSDEKSAYQEFLSGLAKEVAIAQEADRIARAGNPKQAVALLQQESGLTEEVDAKARAAGLKECIRG